MDIHISCTDYVELNSLQEVLKNLTVATSISVTKPLSVKAIKPYEAWHLGFLEIESGALSVQHWIAVFTLVTSKLSQDVFKMCLVKRTLNDGINLTSNYWICLSSSCSSLLQWLAIPHILFKKEKHLTWGGKRGPCWELLLDSWDCLWSVCFVVLY